MSAPTPHPAILEAIRATFGAGEPQLEPLAGGLSGSTLLKLTRGERAYVIRHVRAPNALNDPHRQFACMALAAEREVAPPVLHADAERGVCITAFIDGPPVRALLHAGGAALEELAKRLRTLHEGPAFPRFLGVSPGIVGLHANLARSGIVPHDSERLLASVAEIDLALAPHQVLAPCHLDLNPNNLLWDGARLWIIDWELACQNDPFHDLATLGIYALPRPELRAQLARLYLGHAPAPVEAAHLELARILALAFYGAGLLSVARLRGFDGSGDAEPVPELDALTSTTPAITAADDPAGLGRVFLQEARRACERPGYAQALAILRA